MKHQNKKAKAKAKANTDKNIGYHTKRTYKS
jgi:hypothetical protein